MTELALLTGSEMKPLACSRFRVSQSKPFQALAPSCRVKYRSARTASSTSDLPGPAQSGDGDSEQPETFRLVHDGSRSTIALCLGCPTSLRCGIVGSPLQL